MDISQTEISGRSKVFALCFTNSKMGILIFIYYERLLALLKKQYLVTG